MEEKYTKEICLSLLKDKAAQLHAAGESRFPQRADFSDLQVMAIKTQLGPWPRALEAAGIKEIGGAALKKQEKRARRTRRKNNGKAPETVVYKKEKEFLP